MEDEFKFRKDELDKEFDFKKKQSSVRTSFCLVHKGKIEEEENSENSWLV